MVAAMTIKGNAQAKCRLPASVGLSEMSAVASAVLRSARSDVHCVDRRVIAPDARVRRQLHRKWSASRDVRPDDGWSNHPEQQSFCDFFRTIIIIH